MTGNEIIKALEHCKRPTGKRDCDNCPYVYSRGMCTTNMLNDTIDLLNRQNAEIERYKENEKFIDAKCDSILEKVKTLNSEINEAIVKAKSEAIKEFAERLKQRFSDAIYILPVRNKTLDRDEINKRFTEVIQEDVPAVIDYVLKERKE